MDGTHPETIVFDGHNDVVLRLLNSGESFFDRNTTGHIDLPRALEGGLGGGFCALWVPEARDRRPDADPTNEPPDPEIEEEILRPVTDRGMAVDSAIEEMASLFRIEAESAGRVKVVRTATELRLCLAQRVFAILLHMEGAEAIDDELNALEVFYQAGLRSLGIVWSRPNLFGHGVPFGFGISPDTGPGLTGAGKRLVRACNRLGIVVDLSHLTERGFWDVAAISDAPLVATHSNAHAICPSTRNLTDRQLDAVRDSDGIVGLNFHIGFLRADGNRTDRATPLSVMVRQIDYLVDRLGIDHVGFGSDFDGASIPDAIGDATGLPRLIDALRGAGYDQPALNKLAHENWLRVLQQTWRA